MKLFINNKKEFDAEFPADTHNLNDGYLSSRDIHKKAFTQLSKKVATDFCIPIQIVVQVNECDECLFIFNTKRENVYYYTFHGVI